MCGIVNIQHDTSMMFRVKALSIVTVFLAILLSLSHAIPATRADHVLIVTPKIKGAYGRLIDTIKRSAQGNGKRRIEIEIVDIDGFKRKLPLGVNSKSPKLVVTIGTRAAKAVHDAGVKMPVLSTLIPKAAYSTLHKQNTNVNRQHTALYIDQPLSRQINLIHIALPNHRRVGIILGSYSRIIIKEINIAKDIGKVRVMIRTIKKGENLIKVLNGLLEYTDVLLAVPDPTVFNRGTIHHVLLTTYRQNVPVVGYSKAYVKAGALLAVYSKPEDIGKQTGEMIRLILASKRFQLPPPQYPKYFSVAINYQVARSIGINLGSEESIARKLLGRESNGR